jgi:predicted DsbA family dithiol-disulfide isomerase
VAWRSFELDPAGPRHREGDYVSCLAEKYGVDRDEAQAMVDRITDTAERVGLEFRFDRARPGNTFDAHRLLHLAAERGVQNELKERLLRATFTEGAPIGDPETLVALAAEAGLDADEARQVLAGDDYADAVRADEREAQALGARGVPFFVIDRRYGVSGAQASDLFVEALERAWADAHPPEHEPAAAPAPA